MNQHYNEFDKIVAQLVNRFRGARKGNGSGGGDQTINPLYPILIVLGIWLVTGIYFVAPDEEGVVPPLRQSGLHHPARTSLAPTRGRLSACLSHR